MEATVVDISMTPPSFNSLRHLFHCHCHVSPSILKQPKQVFFLTHINIFEHLLPHSITVLSILLFSF